MIAFSGTPCVIAYRFIEMASISSLPPHLSPQENKINGALPA